ncbi:ribosomal protein L35-like protein [Staphylotrichum tortipilum]|uniref:Dolichyl-diphosphooligosaccharide--protein glycosyltransferase subunit STT3 n=1 Tax=Staphylotrichum tortipilum TaxID=2831512 RepID=A0AAN6MQR2_9PEZI|nr:ribosomal protein L35-like protein [Staphylotrichum longicolle]
MSKSSSKVKAGQLWSKNKDELTKQLGELKTELGQLRIQKIVSSGTKLTKIHDIRKSIARVLTVINAKQRAQLRLFYKNKKYIPLDLRAKQTRAIRRRLSKEDASRVLEKTKKRQTHFPQRKFAVKAHLRKAKYPCRFGSKLQTVLSRCRCKLLLLLLHLFLDSKLHELNLGERHHHPPKATMSADPLQALASAGKGKSTRSVLRVIILALIAGAAVASRLFSVIRTCPVLYWFDPWFNFRATKYLVANGFYNFWDWFDDRTWHPLGRVTGGTLYPGLMVTSGVIYHALRALTIPVDIRNICVLLAPAFSGLTAIAAYLLTNEMTPSSSAGLLAALFMGITPGYISRSVAGSYDNEAIAIFLLVFTFFLWIKALKQGSMLWGALCALFYGYMVASWGGYAFITCLLPLHAFVLICMGRYSTRLYVAYTTWYALGTLASMQIPFVGFLPVKTSEHMPALGIFGFLQLLAFLDYIRSAIPSRQFQTFLWLFAGGTFGVGLLGLVIATSAGIIAPWGGRFYSLWDTSYAKIHIPIIASVSEHQPTAWPAFFFDLNMLIWLFPVGVYLCFQQLADEHVFIVVYALFGSYFAGVMVRLMLTLTPVVCVAAAIAVSTLLDTYLNRKSPKPEDSQTVEGAEGKKASKSGLKATSKPVVGVYGLWGKGMVVSALAVYLLLFVLHCTWVTSNAYSSPSVVLASRMPDGSQHIIDDYREAYQWLRQNTREDAKIMSWWDYGYQIGGMADRPTLVDNNTWNNTHIATVGKAMSSSEEVSYPIMRQHEVDYVLVVFGGLLGYSGDDINKFLWMVRIAEGIWPDEISERSFFTPRGEYRVDGEATETMKNSLMYKMSYYNYNNLFPAGQAVDRMRNVRLPDVGPTLSTLEEAFTSENWIIRIYKVKDLDNIGRDHMSAAAFDRGHKKKKVMKKRGPRVLRVD